MYKISLKNKTSINNIRKINFFLFNKKDSDLTLSILSNKYI